MGFEPTTFGLEVQRAIHCATGATYSNESYIIQFGNFSAIPGNDITRWKRHGVQEVRAAVLLFDLLKNKYRTGRVVANITSKTKLNRVGGGKYLFIKKVPLTTANVNHLTTIKWIAPLWVNHKYRILQNRTGPATTKAKA